MERPVSKGNLLGTPRAEADALLDRAFIETRDYHALVFTADFSFVVGRRGRRAFACSTPSRGSIQRPSTSRRRRL